MVNAPTGDDLFYDDPTVNLLQKQVAELFGKEAAIFVPSGTMANLMSLMFHCPQKGDAAVIGDRSHLNNWERGGMAAAGSIMPITIQNQPDGTMDLNEIEFFCKQPDPHYQVAKLICLESTHNECNGLVLKMDFVKKIKKLAKKHKLKLHLDGARCLNAAVSLDMSPAEMTKDFDTVTLCLSKGLGCPLGSLILCNAKDFKQFLILRKLLGGNFRQAGILAQAGIEALKDWDVKLKQDHDNAQYMAQELAKNKHI